MAQTPIHGCCVSNCFATHCCGASSRAQAEEEDRVPKSVTLWVVYCISILYTNCGKLSAVLHCRCKSNKHRITVSKQEIQKTAVSVVLSKV